jgi:hypothetical protein
LKEKTGGDCFRRKIEENRPPSKTFDAAAPVRVATFKD